LSFAEIMKHFGHLVKNISQDALGIGAKVKKLPLVTPIKKSAAVTLTPTPTSTNTLEYCVNLVKYANIYFVISHALELQ